MVMGVLKRQFCVDMIGGKWVLFVFFSWDRVLHMCRGKFSSVLLTCGGWVSSILLLSLAARCLYVCRSCLFLCLLWGCGNVCGISGIVEGGVFQLRRTEIL